ncbi:hypothetical protein MVES_000693 [Malassezia vespertilionis]|uniref:Uncharacterized protein n=2 Tax=Malassezia vespertilionis TaxID=2020962 RepID=A0A2N1JFV8_9BASI|nr:hypothetical protein MVES_000693 [Malassezia vespertilionis]
MRIVPKKEQSPSAIQPKLRDHLFQTSHDVAELAHTQDPRAAFKDAEKLLFERMTEWHALARKMRAKHADASAHIHPQLAAAAWNQVINLAVRASSPSAAWRLYCKMKRNHIRPTARTYAGYFAALTSMVRDKRINMQESRSWLEHLPKLYQGLDQLQRDAAMRHDAVDEIAGRREFTAPFKRHTAHAACKDPQAIVSAYSSYISLLFALDNPEEGLAVFNAVCPDPYPGNAYTQSSECLPRTMFATAPFYSATLRDIGMSKMRLETKHAVVRDLWSRWQYDIMRASRMPSKRPVVLDAIAVKTLLWTLQLGRPEEAAREVSAMLGTYVGVPFTPAPGIIQYTVPTDWTPLHFTNASLLVDALSFYTQVGMPQCVVDCYTYAEKTKDASGAVQPSTIRDAVVLAERAHAALRKEIGR